MKKFLSFLLAVLMIVSVMIPMLTLLVSAEGDDNENVVPSDYPELVITEICSNPCAVGDAYKALNGGVNATDATKFLASTMYTNDSGDIYAPVVHPGVGALLSNLYVREEDWVNGTVTYKQASGKAVAGTQYYRRYNLFGRNSGNAFEFIEIYNAGTKAVNLYDYQIAIDTDAFKDGDRPIYCNLYGGVVESAAHGQYFRRAGRITAFEQGVAYYQKSNSNTYVQVDSSVAPDPNITYYYEESAGSFIENPSEKEGAWLAPGKVAVIWNFNENDWAYGVTSEIFKAYYSCAEGFAQNWDDILLLGMDGNNSNVERYVHKDKNRTPRVFDEGCWRYGIVPDSVAAINAYDNDRENKWTSWVLKNYLMAVVTNSIYSLQTGIIFGLTKVDGSDGNDYFVYDQKIDQYVPVSKESGTADKNGNAVPGVEYYKPYQNGTVRSSAYCTSDRFLYGIDAAANIKEGRAYVQNVGGVSPGLLDNIQAAVLPNYAENAGALNRIPNLVITEVVPNNGDQDAFEYVEIVNTSGAPLNVFDYTFVAQPDNSPSCYGHIFNKVSPIIPGEYGSILASSTVTKFEEGYTELAPTNVDYHNGWLQPGEAALLWPFTIDSYKSQATFAGFRSYHDIDDSVKVFAMDADNTVKTGRAQRQDLGDSGYCMYGIVANNKIAWANNMYTSEPVLSPVTYSSGKTNSAYCGISLNDCESFVISSPYHVTCENLPFDVGYGYQYVWGNIQGATNKCGSYLCMSYSTSCSADGFSFTGSVLNEVWKASPGKLIAEQKTDMVVGNTNDRYVVYMQDFNGYGNIAGYNAVSEKLGLSGVIGNADLNNAHNANVQTTEKNGINFLEIRDGKLYVNNRGAVDDYMTLLSDDVLSLLNDQSFTIEYSMTYDANSKNTQNGYSGILYNFDAANMTYGAPVVRVSGYGNNAVVTEGQWADIDDGEGHSNSLATKSLSGELTLYERLYGNVYPMLGASNSLDGTTKLAGKSITVRVDVDRLNGVTVTVNGIVVSSTQIATSADAKNQWSQFIENAMGADLVLATSANLSVAYDYITVYTDSDVVQGAVPNLFGNGFMITEFHDEEPTYRALEITNVSNVARNVYDYMIVAKRDMTAAGLQTWNRVIKLNPYCPVSSYDAQYKDFKHISNPTDGMVQPGESVVVWIISDAEQVSDIDLNDFREHYTLEENGDDAVKIIAAYDKSGSSTPYEYGLARRTNYYYSASGTHAFFLNVFSSITAQSDAEFTLGTLSKDQHGLVAALKFVYVGEIVDANDEVINIYYHQSILNGLTDLGIENVSASVSASQTGAKISFRAAIDAPYFNCMVELYGKDNVSYGILVVRADAAAKAQGMRPYLLEAADVSYINDNRNLRSSSSSTRRSISGNSHAVEAGFYSVTYSAMAYLTVQTDAFGTITKYAENAYHQSAKQIVATAMMQYVEADAYRAMSQEERSKYHEILPGKYSLYTREQIDRLNVLCK